jgi:hypothetical protein
MTTTTSLRPPSDRLAATPPLVSSSLPPSSRPPSGRRPLRRIVRGRPADAAWVRPALLALLIATGALYLWDLSASGYANGFYAAAV